MLCRVVQGLAQGFLYPCILNIVSKWTPAFERSRVSAFVYGGASVGIVTSMPLTGAIAGSTWGWPVACYLYGGLGLLWTGVFTIFAANSPDTHRWISEEEKKYIESTTCLKTCTKVLLDCTPTRFYLYIIPENTDAVEVHVHVATHVGNFHSELRLQLGFLHTNDRNPQLYGQHHALQHQRGTTSSP